ncbi:MAG: acyltransferase [Cyanobacteria bacterium P01_H01_bin.74]
MSPPSRHFPHNDDTAESGIFIHETSTVEPPSQIGANTTVHQFSHVMSNAIIGRSCKIGRNVTIESGVMVGNFVDIMHNSQINSGVIVEDNVYCGFSVVFEDTRRIRATPKTISQVSPTIVRKGASIGANTTVASGNTIGQFSFIEAGSIVDRNIPDFAVACGNPIQLIGWRCKCGQALTLKKNQKAVKCNYCNRHYNRQSQWKLIPFVQDTAIIDAHTNPYSQSHPAIRTSQQ